MPDTPLRSADSTSWAIRPACTCRIRSSLEPVGVEPELAGVARPGPWAAGRPGAASSRSCISQNAPCAAAASAASAASWAVRVDVGQRQVAPDVADVARRPAGPGRPARPGRSTGTRSRRTRRGSPTRPSGPRTWSRSGSTAGIRSISCSDVPSSARARRAVRQQRGDPVDRPGQRGATARPRSSAPELGLGQPRRRVNARCGDQQRHGEADAGEGAAARDRRPAHRGPDPAPAEPRSPARPSRPGPTGLPTT